VVIGHLTKPVYNSMANDQTNHVPGPEHGSVQGVFGADGVQHSRAVQVDPTLTHDVYGYRFRSMRMYGQKRTHVGSILYGQMYGQRYGQTGWCRITTRAKACFVSALESIK